MIRRGAALAAAVLTLGCGASYPPYATEFASGTGTFQPTPVRFSPGDTVEFRFHYAPELNDEQIVRADGMLTMQFIGDVRAAGLTPQELSAEFARRYESQLIRADNVVILREYGDRRIYVAGEVITPGPVEMPGNMTALEAVVAAGGFDMTSAELRNVIVIRRGEGGYEAVSVDLAGAMRGSGSPMFALEPRDIVYVPRTRIVQVNQWLAQHIGGIFPGLGFTYTRPLGDGFIGVTATNR